MKTIDTQLFDQFWKAYPARNKKKVGKYPCSLWFEAKRPSPSIVDAMVDWIEQDKANRASVERDGGFYAPPKDPIRFLKDRMWEDDIGVILTKQQRQEKSTKERSDALRKRNVAGYIRTYERIILERTIQQLVTDKIFMHVKKAYPEFRAWALEKRPLLEGARPDHIPAPGKKVQEPVKPDSAADLPPPRDDDFTGQSQVVDDFVKKLDLFE